MRSEGYCSCPVCVCMSVRSFLPPCACRSQNIGTNGFTAMQNFFFESWFLLKMLCSEATASFACLGCHQLHLNPKSRIPRESAEGWKVIDSRDFNLKDFVQKLQYICLPPSCAYPQYKYAHVYN